MKFLLVNDDGYKSEGILLLEEALKPFGEVFVVAPSEHQSGKSCGLIYNKKINFIKHDSHHYEVNDLPTGCVIFGLFGINQKFDIVFSGVNDGENLSNDTMYSGTVGACHQALFSGVPAIAISAINNFEVVRKHIDEVLKYVLNNKLYSKDYLLNINFPLGNNYKGIKLTSLHYSSKIEYQVLIDENKSYMHKRSGEHDNLKKSSDVYEVKHGYCSISALSPFNLDKGLMKKLKGKIK